MRLGGEAVPLQTALKVLESWKPDPIPKDMETVTVHHATTQKDAEAFKRDGVIPQLKPWTLASRRYAEGEEAEFAPGKGLERGIYVGDKQTATSFGEVTIDIEIPVAWLELPVESTADTPQNAIKDEMGAVIKRAIPPEAITWKTQASAKPGGWRSVNFDSCKRGETAAKTGCTPESGEGEKEGGRADIDKWKPGMKVPSGYYDIDPGGDYSELEKLRSPSEMDKEDFDNIIFENPHKIVGRTVVTDKNGDPRPVFHGSQSSEDVIQWTDDKITATGVGGFWFTDRKSYAEGYAEGRVGEGNKGGGKVHSVYLRLENPGTFDDRMEAISEVEKTGLDRSVDPVGFHKKLVEIMKKKGFDGFTVPGEEASVVFDPEQIIYTDHDKVMEQARQSGK